MENKIKKKILKNTSKHLGYVRLCCGFCNRQFNIFFILIQTHLFHLCKKGIDYDSCSNYPSVMLNELGFYARRVGCKKSILSTLYINCTYETNIQTQQNL